MNYTKFEEPLSRQQYTIPRINMYISRRKQ